MNWTRGFGRLAGVVCVLWALSVVVYNIDLFRPFEKRDYVINVTPTSGRTFSRLTEYDRSPIETHDRNELPANMTLWIPKSTPPHAVKFELLEFEVRYVLPVYRPWQLRTGRALLLALAPPFLIFVVGGTILWIIRGFRRQSQPANPHFEALVTTPPRVPEG